MDTKTEFNHGWGWKYNYPCFQWTCIWYQYQYIMIRTNTAITYNIRILGCQVKLIPNKNATVGSTPKHHSGKE